MQQSNKAGNGKPLNPYFFTLQFYTMNLIFRQQGPDHFSIYDFQIFVDGKYRTQYVAEMYGHHSGRYAIGESDSYIKALRMLAKFKNNL